jgi:hypothetical protein
LAEGSPDQALVVYKHDGDRRSALRGEVLLRSYLL